MSSPVDDTLDRIEAEYPDYAATLRSALQQLREERDALARDLATWRDSSQVRYERAEAAEAEARRLTEGLRELLDAFPMADPYGSLWEDYRKAQDKARALLSASPSDGPDDFCEHGYTTENAAHPSAGLERCPTCSPTDGGGARRLVSVNHDAATDIVGKSAICPDCGNALLIESGGGAK